MLLDAAHHIHDPFVDLREIALGQGTGVATLHIGDHLALALGLVNGQTGIAFQSSNFDGGGRALIEQRRQFAVQFVDFLAPIGNVHRAFSHQLSAVSLTAMRGPKMPKPHESQVHQTIIEQAQLMADG
jgi:hypothetical protein